MAITKNTIPSIMPTRVLPFDANLAFTTNSAAQTLTATGYFGAPAQLDIGPGRWNGYWAIDITAIDFASGDETYRLFLLGSNDVNWANGNVDILATRDFAAASSGRLIATIAGATPTVPPTNMAGSVFAVPATNQMADYVYRYLRCYAVIGGTTPSITAQTYLTPDCDG